MQQSCRTFMIALLLLALTGCSSTTFIYNRLDFIIPWYVDDYVDLTREQKRELDALLTPFLSWHRGEELPSYLPLLEKMQETLDAEVTPAALEALVAEAEEAWLRTENRGLNWMIALGESLSPEQMNEFMLEMRDKQEEYEEKYLARSDAEYRDDAYDNMRDATSDYLGRLDKSQRAIYQEAAAQLQRSDTIWLRERAAWLDQLELLLQREPGWQQRLREALAAREQTTSDDYQAVYDNNVSVLYGAVAAVINARSERQDKRLRSKLADLQEDLKELISQKK